MSIEARGVRHNPAGPYGGSIREAEAFSVAGQDIFSGKHLVDFDTGRAYADDNLLLCAARVAGARSQRYERVFSPSPRMAMHNMAHATHAARACV